MKLRPEFEITQVGFLNRNHVPSFDVCLNELLCKKQRMDTPGGYTETSEIVNIVAYGTW